MAVDEQRRHALGRARLAAWRQQPIRHSNAAWRRLTPPPRRLLPVYPRLQQVLGEEHAVTLMAHLPPAGSDVATRQDVEATRQDLEAFRQEVQAGFAALEPRFEAIDRRFDAVEDRLSERIDLRTSEWAASIKAIVHAEIGAVRAEMVSQTRTLVFAMIGAMTTIAALAFTAARLALP